MLAEDLGGFGHGRDLGPILDSVKFSSVSIFNPPPCRLDFAVSSGARAGSVAAVKALACLLSLLLAATAMAEKPDILVILADDLGWSDLGCYGGEIETPVLDSLAAGGLRFRQFYNAARCCPTRASLLTGLYPHQAGMGGMVDSGGKRSGPYQGYLNEHCVTLAEVLRPAGYRTLHAGKWHVGENRPHWPVDRGFDRFYGLISGAMNYFDISKSKRPGIERVFAIDSEPHHPEPGDFYATDAFTDHALRMLEETPAEQPLFLYLAYTAPHWPLHAPESLIAKYEPRYRESGNALRQARLRRQIDAGLLPPGTELSSSEMVSKAELSEEQLRETARKLATHAAMVDRMDWNIGRVVEHLRKTGRLDNTLILFLSDNGASSEEGPLGKDFRPDLTGPIGSVDSYHSYGRHGANLSNTPLRKYKAQTEEGGLRTPCIVHWPAGLKTEDGAFTDEVGHIIDLMPTLREISGASYPEKVGDHPIRPEEGLSLLPVFRAEDFPDRTLGWEHFGHAAWREGPWKIVRSGRKQPWELYHLDRDPLELEDLAEKHPDRLQRMTAAWTAWSEKIGVR